VAALLCLVTAVGLAGCGTQASAAEPLGKVTQLSGSGIVTKEQLQTLEGKTGTYEFVGKSGDIKYTWLYDAAQVKNPTDQHLALALSTKGEAVSAVKKAANKAPYALSVRLSNFELAGSPQLKIELPQKWTANRLAVVTGEAKNLKQISAAQPSLQTTKKSTTLTATVTLTNKTLYFVGGLNKSGLGSQSGSGSSGTSSDSADSADSSDSTGSSDFTDAADSNAETGASTGSGTAGSDSAQASESSSKSASGTTSSSNVARAQGSSAAAGKSTATANDGTFPVTISVDAKTLASHLGEVAANKRPFVPSDGWIIRPTTVRLTEGQTAYDALVKVTKSRHVQMESRWTPLYNSYYVNGIHQLYEFDGGQTSGWMYSVDGWFPNYGSSSYSSLHSGSVIQWRYTRNLGADVGGSGASGR
jgi:hypothetical protein